VRLEAPAKQSPPLFPACPQVGLPKAPQRVQILRHYLRRHDDEVAVAQARGAEAALLLNSPCEGTGGAGAVDWIASRTEGFSGSDLAELCSQAAQQCLADYWQQRWWAARPAAAALWGPSPSTHALLLPAGPALPAMATRPSCCPGGDAAIAAPPPPPERLAAAPLPPAGGGDLLRPADRAIRHPPLPPPLPPVAAPASCGRASAPGRPLTRSMPAHLSMPPPPLRPRREAEADGRLGPDHRAMRVRPLALQDFAAVLQHMRPATQQAEDYRMASSGQGGGGGRGGGGGGGARALPAWAAPSLHVLRGCWAPPHHQQPPGRPCLRLPPPGPPGPCWTSASKGARLRGRRKQPPSASVGAHEVLLTWQLTRQLRRHCSLLQVGTRS
jgi:hypothetical protein